MSHLSDYSFLQRVVSLGYLSVWSVYRIWTQDKFECLYFKRIMRGDLKGILTLLLAIMLPFQMCYDIITSKIKYEEGFMDLFGHIISKPNVAWSASNKGLLTLTEYSLSISVALQCGILFLLQCYWNHVAVTLAKVSFIGRKEFTFYIFCAFVSAVGFPLMQYIFSLDIFIPTYKEIMPQLIFGVVSIPLSFTCILWYRRFQKLLKEANRTNDLEMMEKIRSYRDPQKIMAIGIFLYSLGMTILSSDGLTSRKHLNTHKFPADFIICNINICSFIVWFSIILVLFPKRLPPMPIQPDLIPATTFVSGAKSLGAASDQLVKVHLNQQDSLTDSKFETTPKNEPLTSSAISAQTLVTNTTQYAHRESHSTHSFTPMSSTMQHTTQISRTASHRSRNENEAEAMPGFHSLPLSPQTPPHTKPIVGSARPPAITNTELPPLPGIV